MCEKTSRQRSSMNAWHLLAGLLATGLSLPALLGQSMLFPTYQVGANQNLTNGPNWPSALPKPWVVSNGQIITPAGTPVYLGTTTRAKAIAVNPNPQTHTAAVLQMGAPQAVTIFNTLTGAVLHSTPLSGGQKNDSTGSSNGITYTPDGLHLLFSQDSSHVTIASVDPTNQSNPAIEALTDKDPCGGHLDSTRKADCFVHRSLSIETLIGPLFMAVPELAKPPAGYPAQWRKGPAAFGRLYGDALALQTVQQTSRFLTGLGLHEDLRYYPAASRNPLRRVLHAITFAAFDRSDSGRTTVAASNFLGAAAGGFVGNAYLPLGYDDPSHAVSREWGSNSAFSWLKTLWTNSGLSYSTCERHCICLATGDAAVNRQD